MPTPCPHQTCNPNDTLWLPRLDDEEAKVIVNKGEAGRHRYCTACGLVKVDGDGRGRGEGFYFSLANALGAHFAQNRAGRKMTRIDVRLICAEIRGRDIFTDPYGVRRAMQDGVFIEIVLARRNDLNRAAVREFVVNFKPKSKRRPAST